MTRHLHIIVAVMIALASIWEFEGVRHAGFIYQDTRWQTATEFAQVSSVMHRPLMLITWKLQERYTPSPAAFHVVNLTLHLAVSMLVWVLVYRLSWDHFTAMVAFIVFLCNPAQGEAAIYLSGRTELLAALGVIAACTIFSAHTITWWQAVLAVMAVVFGFMGKESAVVAVALLPLVRRNWTMAVVAIGAVVMLVGVAANNVVQANHHPALWAFTQAAAAWHLVWSAFTLNGIAVDYDYAGVPVLAQWAYVVMLVMISAAGWVSRYRYPLSAIGALWMIAVIAPRLAVFTPLSIFNQHQFYLGRVGVAIITADVATHIVKWFDTWNQWEVPYEVA